MCAINAQVYSYCGNGYSYNAELLEVALDNLT